MSVFSKIGSYIPTSLFSLSRSEKIQEDKISQTAQKKMCKMCLRDTSLDQLQMLQHTTNLNCIAHRKKYACLDCASKITIKKCPLCSQKLSPTQNLSLNLFRKFTLLESENESLKERVASVAFNAAHVGIIMVSLGSTVAQGEVLAAKYGYVLNPDTCKPVVYALVGAGFPLALGGYLVVKMVGS